ncbi:MAG: hypothetical protein U1E20_13960 [Methylocystis sp.]|uniref:hypothetical protein n=1 Tax=Methylocystis sp. TaxID=1911079 RepID=UPI0039493BFD
MLAATVSPTIEDEADSSRMLREIWRCDWVRFFAQKISAKSAIAGQARNGKPSARAL